MAAWEWDAASRRYRNVDTGRYLSASASIELRDDLVSRLRSDTDALARRLAAEDLTVQQWEAAMQANVRTVNTVQMSLGRGGRNAMTDDDRTALAELIRGQHEYLRSFAEDIAAGRLSEAQISARSKLYYGSSTQAYERGRASAWGVRPPHVPGDGSTECMSACRCFLIYVDKPDAVHVTWHTTSGESCATCKSRARTWSPLVISKPTDGRVARLWRQVA